MERMGKQEIGDSEVVGRAAVKRAHAGRRLGQVWRRLGGRSKEEEKDGGVIDPATPKDDLSGLLKDLKGKIFP